MVIRGKKGQQLTLGTIILIILGVAVLIFLIFGFTTGWKNLFDKITNFGGGDANVDTIAQACEIACSTNAENAYCYQSRTVNYGDDIWEKGSCESLEGSSKISISCSIPCNAENVPELTGNEKDDFVGPPAAP